MKRSAPRRIGLLLGLLTILWAQVAAALSYYDPAPQGSVGLSRPTISQRLVLDPGEQISGAEMWIDGRQVIASWDQSGRVSYTPPAALAPGPHRVRLVVRVSPGRPGYYYPPLETEFSFTVSPEAPAELPGPGPEERRALDWVNRYRQQAGVAPLAYDDRLAAAAVAHARYLILHPGQIDSDGHGEEPGAELYTGRTSGERAVYFTFDGGSAEVINFVDRAEDAVDGWIDTLYHRIPLLHPGMSVMGYGLAGTPGRNVNIIQAGPYEQAAGLVRWPYNGQREVPPMWNGLETPDPLDLYPGTPKPVGYPITLTFGGHPRLLRLTAARLTGPDGDVAVLRYDPTNDARLDDTVSLIPVSPLQPAATYTVTMRGDVDLGEGVEPFAQSWSFRTASEYHPLLKRRIGLTVEGEGFGQGMQAFVGGLPVGGLAVASQQSLSFTLPPGPLDPSADLLVVTPGGVEEIWESFLAGESLPAQGRQPFSQVGVLVRGQYQRLPALLHSSGTLLLPDETLFRLGGTARQVAAIDRTYWQMGAESGEYTMGRVTASTGSGTLRLALPVQRQLGAVYLDAAFVRELAGVESQVIAGELYVGNRIRGILDIEGHWGLPAIEQLLGAGIVSGYGDGSFRPNAPLSRAAFVKMLAAAGGLPLRPGDSGPFADTREHWVSSQGYLGAAVAAGLVRPAEYPGGRFEPDREISREEIAVMVTRSLGLEDEALGRQVTLQDGAALLGAKTFADASLWSRPGYIAEAVEAGIITGYAEADGRYTFRPVRSATRAEAAVMVVRSLNGRP